MKKIVVLMLPGLILFAALAYELQTSYVQSWFFTRVSAMLNYHVEAAESDTAVFPVQGPYNYRQGFSRLPEFTDHLRQHGYEIVRQTRFSESLLEYIKWGGRPLFHEKTQSGLTILDESGETLYQSRYPARIYREFSDIPHILVESLLFIENRELLSDDRPLRNPAVEWSRLTEALAARVASLIVPGWSTPGASTLATQLEKYRYSPGGRTPSMSEKLQQMVAASLKAYQAGPRTRVARERIVRDYLNSTPLSGRAGIGEIHGLGDGLWAWYGMDFDTTNSLLREPDQPGGAADRARALRAALSLMLSQRRPSYYLVSGRDELARLTDRYLRLLANNGIISPRLRDAALAQSVAFPVAGSGKTHESFVERKAVNNIRTDLLAEMGAGTLYNMDRLDLTVESSIAGQVQEQVTAMLRKLTDKEAVGELGLIGDRLLDEEHLDAVRYSVVLYESTPWGNLLRLQADNLDKPLDLNDGSMLDLGSTAKLRTLISYLEIVESLYRRYRDLPPESLSETWRADLDPIRRWALEFLRGNPLAGLREILKGAMERTYSANSAEQFFTAGGLHRFRNFDSKDDHLNLSVAEALNRSVNLVFIRLMRDIVRYHTSEPRQAEGLFDDRDNPAREAYLRRFADREGRLFLRRFYQVYQGLGDEARLDTLGRRTPAVPRRLAMAFRAVNPVADESALREFLASRLGDKAPGPELSTALYKEYDPARFDHNDRAFLADVHPLELWLVKYLGEYPAVDLREVIDASADERQSAYEWLFKTGHTGAQDRRIRIELERQAFENIHRQWQRLGYPFDSLVPSYATALGASADRPAALAELMGILVNDGIRLPSRQIERLRFAEGTPYETVFARSATYGERVLSSEVSAVVREALVEVVNSGTGRRLNGVFQGPGGEALVTGGKTGTGDHRSKHFDSAGRLIDMQVENRNAIFTFFIDERYFGTIMAHVGGPAAAEFDFSSALAAQLLKAMEPALSPLMRRQLPQQLAMSKGGVGVMQVKTKKY